MTKIQLTQELVKFLFDYKDGFLYLKNKQSSFNTKQIGSKAGYMRTINSGIRRVIKIDGKDYLSARLIFFYHHGWWPEIVDHKDKDYQNDLIDNLRAATKSQNNKNTSSRKGSTSKYLGVCFIGNRWIASIWVNNTSKYLGRFLNEIDAAKTYNEAAKIYHGEFASLNIIQP